MSIYTQIIQLNDRAKIAGSRGLESVWLSEPEFAALMRETRFIRRIRHRPIGDPAMVDGVKVYWNGRY